MGSILGTRRSHTRFCGGLPQRRGRENSRKFVVLDFVNSPNNGFENLVVLKYRQVSGIPSGMGFDFCF